MLINVGGSPSVLNQQDTWLSEPVSRRGWQLSFRLFNILDRIPFLAAKLTTLNINSMATRSYVSISCATLYLACKNPFKIN